MDNLTHSLAGMLLADAVCSFRGEVRPRVRRAASLVSALANNLPDTDIVYSWIDGPRPLGSLLHHRGHTHTVLVGSLMAWALGVLAFRLFRRKEPEAGQAERRLLLGLALAGPLLHLLMDFGNNYGVHPFWPVYSGWLYGDSIFIIEPLWLMLAIPSLARTLTVRWLAILLWAVLGALLVVTWYVPFVHTAARFVLIACAAASYCVAKKATDRARSGFTVGAWLCVAAVFALTSSRAKAELRSATAAAFPALTVHDIAMSPLPANPACWEALLAGEQGGTYRALRASVALAPLEAASCRAGEDVDPSAPVVALSRAQHGGVRWLSEYRAELSDLSRLRHDDCRFRALLRFARLPYANAAGTLAGDLRYDREPGRDFSDVALHVPHGAGPCPRFVPSWLEPRRELFQP